MKNYFLFLALCAVIITQINCTNKVQQHDLTDEDILNAMVHLLQDIDINTHLLGQKNLTINEIKLKDDALVEFKGIKFIKSPPSNLVHTSLSIWAEVNKYVTISIPLGYPSIEGFFKKLSNGKVYPFIWEMKVYAEIEKKLNSTHNIDDELGITIYSAGVEIKTNEPLHDQYDDMLKNITNNQLPLVKSQILDQLLAQIKKQDLLPYFSTVINYFFPPKIDPSKLHHLINQTYVLTNSSLEPPYDRFIIDWIKLKSLTFALSFNRRTNPDRIAFEFFSYEPMNVTFKGYYAGKGRSKKPSEYNIQLNSIVANVYVENELNQTTSPSTNVYIGLKVSKQSNDSDTSTWLHQYGQQIQQIIIDDWRLFLEKKFANLSHYF